MSPERKGFVVGAAVGVVGDALIIASKSNSEDFWGEVADKLPELIIILLFAPLIGALIGSLTRR